MMFQNKEGKLIIFLPSLSPIVTGFDFHRVVVSVLRCSFRLLAHILVDDYAAVYGGVRSHWRTGHERGISRRDDACEISRVVYLRTSCEYYILLELPFTRMKSCI